MFDIKPTSNTGLKKIKEALIFNVMIELHYVGFNGYEQCPQNENHSPKVIADWVNIEHEDLIKVVCSHRIVVVQTKEFLKLYGHLNLETTGKLQSVKIPTNVDNFGSDDEFLIASEKTNLWRLRYKNLEWEKVSLSFVCKDEEIIWNEPGNKVVKFSFLLENLVLLLSNGSVWRLTKRDKLKIVFPYDVDKAIDIASGLEHCLVLTESGCVLSFGNGSRGQLGHGDLNSTHQPIQIPALEGLNVVKISAGGWHSCAITDSGDLCTWGWNNYGQISAFEEEGEMGLSASPVFVDVGAELEMPVVDVACGSRHTIAKLENGDLYATGWNTYRQLGIDSSVEKVSKFTKCNVQKSQTKKLLCGPWYTILVEEPEG